MDLEGIPEFDLLCAGFPCQAFSIAGRRGGFTDPRGTLFFEVARLAEKRRPAYLLFENVPGLLSHDKGRTFTTILHTLSQLGYHVEWKVLNSKDFGVPQSRKRVYIVGYLDGRCAGKVLPDPPANGTALIQVRTGELCKRGYHPGGLSCTLTAQAGGLGGTTGLYAMGIPIKEKTKTGYKLAYPGDSIDLGYAGMNSRRGRVGRGIAHTLTTDILQGTLETWEMSDAVEKTDVEQCLTMTDTHGALYYGRIRRLTPRECLRLQGYTDVRIDRMMDGISDRQLYKQAGNGVTVTVIEAIGRQIHAADDTLRTDQGVCPLGSGTK